MKQELLFKGFLHENTASHLQNQLQPICLIRNGQLFAQTNLKQLHGEGKSGRARERWNS